MKFPALEVSQGVKKFYAFKCRASELWSFSQINQRQEDKDEGYQRVLSAARVKSIKSFIERGNVIPGSIVISFDKAKFIDGKIDFSKKSDSAWIIDGQHRCAGAAEAAVAGKDIDLSVVAFIGLSPEEQADYFVTINREAKGVPSSLYLDLLRHLPKQKSDKERLEERIADISRILTRDEESVFFQRIVSTTSPKADQISLTNFARVMRSICHPTNGILGAYNINEQVKILDNYMNAFKLVFPKAFAKNLFFKTIGFGAMFRAFPVIFSNTLKSHSAFRVGNVVNTLENISAFDFDQWSKQGTGSQAEIMAGDDLIAEFKSAVEAQDGSVSIALD